MGMTNDGLSHWLAESEGIELLETTLGDLLDIRAQECSEAEAVVYSCYPEFGGELDIRWTYAQYREKADQVARGLIALGLNKGEHIAIWALNVPEWPLLLMGAAKAGLVLVPLNPALRAQEIEYILKQGDVAALFLMEQIREHNCLETVHSLIDSAALHGIVTSERLPHLRVVCLLATPLAEVSKQTDWQPLPFRVMVAEGTHISDEALRQRQAAVIPHDPVLMLYTSGTTGIPKGALLTHVSLLNQAWTASRRLKLDAQARICVQVPLFHIFGCSLTITALCLGGTVHPLLSFTPLKALQIISTERCTFTGGVPTMLLAMLQHADFEQYDLSSLQLVMCGGAPVPVFLMEHAKERIGAEVVIAFGQTESTGAITLTLLAASFELKAATVGIPLAHVEVKIIDTETGALVRVEERGELCVRGWLVMAGYYQLSEQSSATIDQDGWLHTGDIATVDARGSITLLGRLKEMVIRGGENIFPREIEEFLLRHPGVADVAVVGVPDQFFGEELLAVVIPNVGQTVTIEELRSFSSGQISKQKIPRYWRFIDKYPMTASGKVQKHILREQALKALGLETVGTP